MGKIEGKEAFSDSLIKAPLELADNMDVLIKKMTQFIDLMKQSEGAIGVAKSTKKVREENSKLLTSQKELQKIEQQILTTRGKLISSRSTEAKQLAELKVQQTERNKTLREEAKETRGLIGAFDRLRKSRDAAARTLKNLIASEKASNAEIRKAQANFDKLNAKTEKANRAAKQFQSNVGNYPNKFRAATASLKMFVGAFGLVGGIALFARTITDAFKRIREFDKAVVELAAILGKTRDEIVGIEKEIIRVASASTKTSTEVAQLATTLATLGKTEAEIKNLLKPVNDLSIALKATSEESGELLVATLNAFGEGSSEAKRYADIIAKMRTSTALDFQRIKEALGFLAPTAKAAGISFERTGAILGVLVDNGIKAARAGRLTSTSFLKLADSGKTLEDALDEINAAQQRTTNEQEILAVSSKLFGKEAAGIGLILANNRVKTDELTKSLENSKGTLQELTDAQLESFDAKLKILDSSWERFILNITDGNNFLAKDFKGSIATLTGWFDSLSDAIDGTDRKFENWKDRVRESDPSAQKLSLSLDNLNEKIKENQAALAELPQGNAQIFRDQIAAQEEVIAGLETQKAFILELQQAKVDEALEAERIAKEAAAAEIAAAKVVAEEKKRISDKASGDRIASNQAQLDAEKELNREINADLDDWVADELQTRQELNDEIETINQQRRDNELKAEEENRKKIDKANDIAFDKLMKEQEEKEAIKLALINQSFELAGDAANRFTDLRIQQIGQEIDALELARNRELEVEGITAAQKDEINEKFDKKKVALQRKQANAEKQNALFQIALNTAVSIIKTGAQLGYPAAIPFVILAAAAGVAQSAAVLAAPVPQFDEGSESTPADYIAGERRPELRKSKGKWSLVDRPTLFGNSPGDKILGGKETNEILGTMADLNAPNLLSPGNVLSGLESRKERKQSELIGEIQESNKILRGIKNKATAHISVSRQRTDVKEKHGGLWVNRLDARYRGKV